MNVVRQFCKHFEFLLEHDFKIEFTETEQRVIDFCYKYKYPIRLVFVLEVIFIMRGIKKTFDEYTHRHDEITFDYGYAEHNGPHTWEKVYPNSLGFAQSPINIERAACWVSPVRNYPRFFASGFSNVPVQMIMTNDGRTVEITCSWEDDSRPIFRGGPLHDPYNFAIMTFHWGENDDDGTEHSLDGEHFALEIQVTHVLTLWNRLSEVTGYDVVDGVVTVACLFEISEEDNPGLFNIVDYLQHIRKVGEAICVREASLDWLHLDFDEGYYSYMGSMTTPPCNENVRWIINPTLLRVSRRQMAEFRKLESPDGLLVKNCRPLQPLNDRDVSIFK